jgi:hypothetical protein
MSYAEVNGVCLHCEEHGPGQPLVLLHGGYGTGHRQPGGSYGDSVHSGGGP